jgi:hypothetical protein
MTAGWGETYYSKTKEGHMASDKVWKQNGYDRLVPLYKKYWKNIVSLKKSDAGLSNPHLICFPDNFEKQRVRLLTIGQQTGPNRWHQDYEINNSIDSITGLMDSYYDYYIGCYDNRRIFFQAVRRVESMLNIDRCNSVWSEIDKMDLNGKAANFDTSRKMYDSFPVLKQEIEISKPDVVVFFTGPNYDNNIKYIFKNALFEKVGNHPVRQFSKISHPELPDKTFRTYHPNYLRRSKMWNDVLGEHGVLKSILKA